MLCNWKPGDIITAHHLNQMTCAINANTSGLNQLGNIVSDKGSSSFSGSGGIDMGAFTGTGLESCTSCLNRGYIRSGWEYAKAGENKKGLFVNKSGVENALSGSYPEAICAVCLGGEISGQGVVDIMVKTFTDCYGKVLSQCIFTQSIGSSNSSNNSSNVLWKGPDASSSSGGSSQNTYSITRRIGRLVDDTSHPIGPCDSTYYNKVLNTNDLVMPILPVRAEKEENHPCHQSMSLIGDYKDNSVLIKNIKNGGGLDFTPCTTNLQLKSGVEFHAGKISESCGGTPTTTFPDVTGHIKPQEFDITIACIPIKEQHYSWCKTSNSWVKSLAPSGDSSSEPSTAEPTKKGDIKITAKSLNGNNWQIGWATSGEVEIPVKDFTPGEGACYTEGRGISIKEETTTDGKKYTICNTMEICAGCNISIEQTDGDKPAFKINACKMKLEAGDGIKVECITGGYKISACESQAICITNGAGISVTKNNNTYTISNTAIHDAVEVVEGEGIKVTQIGNKYKVSLASSEESTEDTGDYIFDPEWFIVTDNNVTINQAKVQAVGDGIAVNTSVNANITRVMERTITGNGYEGDIMARVNGLEGGLCATARVTWEQGTHSDEG